MTFDLIAEYKRRVEACKTSKEVVKVYKWFTKELRKREELEAKLRAHTQFRPPSKLETSLARLPSLV